ncbi:MAG: beta strand repeat-containing protein, partial [Planctomycetaceae bacterium]
GSITEITAAETANITTSATATLSAATGIGASGGGSIDTAIASLQATNSVSGDIFITEANTLDVSGTGLRTLAGNGSVTLTVAAGSLSINANISAHGTGIITLNTTVGDTTQSAGTITASGLLLLGAGSFTLNQSGNDVDSLAADLNTGAVAFTDLDDLNITTVASTSGITTGGPGTGGNVTVTAGGTITVTQPISTVLPSDSTATGTLSLSGGVQVNNTITSGGGNISLTGASTANTDLIVNSSLTSGGDISLTAPRDAFSNGVVSTTGTNADITVMADSDTNGTGGVLLTTSGGISAIATVTLRGSAGQSATFSNAGVGSGTGFSLLAPLSTVAVQIDSDGTNNQVSSTGTSIVIDSHGATTGSDIVINGRITTTTNGGTLLVTADA